MLNAIPDSRPPEELIGGFLAPNDVIGGDHADETEDPEQLIGHESITLGERRKSSIYSGKSGSSSSSVDLPARNHVVGTGKRIFTFFFEKNSL